MPSNTAARIGPIEGIWQSSFHALCFLLSASNSRRTCWRNDPQRIELLVVKLRPAAHPRFGDLRQPLGTMARCIDLLAGTRNGPTAIDGLHPGHDPGEIFGDGQITAHQFLQGS